MAGPEGERILEMGLAFGLAYQAACRNVGTRLERTSQDLFVLGLCVHVSGGDVLYTMTVQSRSKAQTLQCGNCF